MGLTREICKLCYHENPIGFNVPDEIWNVVAPIGINILCIDCFTTIADIKGIQWDKDIQLFPVSLITSRLSFELPSQQGKQTGVGEQHDDGRVTAGSAQPSGGESHQSNVS